MQETDTCQRVIVYIPCLTVEPLLLQEEGEHSDSDGEISDDQDEGEVIDVSKHQTCQPLLISRMLYRFFIILQA